MALLRCASGGLVRGGLAGQAILFASLLRLGFCVTNQREETVQMGRNQLMVLA